MHIFIDESGTFTRGVGARPSISAVGALIVPDGKLPVIEKKYSRLRPRLPKHNGEVKGRLLNELEVDRVVSILLRNETLFELSMVDLNLCSDEAIQRHQTQQAEKITANITERHSAFAKNYANDLRSRLEGLTQQLYLQSVVTFDVIAQVFQHSTLYYAQRRPRELGAFHWVIDAKDRMGAVDWEKWWSAMIQPWLQSLSIHDPLPLLEGADYSAFKRFDATIPPYLMEVFGETDENNGTNIAKVMTESFRFSPASDVGLELVDVLTNAT